LKKHLLLQNNAKPDFYPTIRSFSHAFASKLLHFSISTHQYIDPTYKNNAQSNLMSMPFPPTRFSPEF